MKNTSQYYAIRDLPNGQTLGANDTLVLFGELFQRGYANGLVEEAESRKMTIIRSTVGRRDKEGHLQSLSAEDAALVPAPFINRPLEAGFDYEKDDNGVCVIDLLKDVKLSDWESFKIDRDWLQIVKQKARNRFRQQVKNYIQDLIPILPKKGNVFIAHLMAGGVPRAKIIMPLMNRSFKGTGERYLPSQKFWESDLGWICSKNFYEVTAETFHILIDETQNLAKNLAQQGRQLCFSAYGYHGTEILVNQEFQWQTYTPYLQGWAKKKLEDYSRQWSAKGVHCCVYNCPEILTNSSSIFSGVEVSLYPLMGAIKMQSQLSKDTQQKNKLETVLQNCMSLVKDEVSLNEILDFCKNFLSLPEIQAHNIFEKWPQHSNPEQLTTMLNSSEHLFHLHKDQKNLITGVLSEVVLKSCGKIIMQDVLIPQSPVSWINHDVIAKTVST